jgi:putative transposase
MCTVLKVSRSGYYKWRHHVPGQQEKRRQKLMKRIQYHFDGYKQRYRSPKIAVKLRGEGWIVSTKTVSRLMKKMGLCSRTVNKYKATTNSNHSLPVFDNLLNQNFQVLAPNCTWVADITHSTPS